MTCALGWHFECFSRRCSMRPRLSGWSKPCRCARRRRRSEAIRLQLAANRPPGQVGVQPPPVARSEALTLLAALQREARFLDIIQEPLGSYSDAQIGAAARDVLRNCAAVLARWFALAAICWRKKKGVPWRCRAGYDPQRFRVVGNVSGDPPFRGQLVHRGWLATKCDLPGLVRQQRIGTGRRTGRSGSGSTKMTATVSSSEST